MVEFLIACVHVWVYVCAQANLAMSVCRPEADVGIFLDGSLP